MESMNNSKTLVLYFLQASNLYEIHIINDTGAGTPDSAFRKQQQANRVQPRGATYGSANAEIWRHTGVQPMGGNLTGRERGNVAAHWGGKVKGANILYRSDIGLISSFISLRMSRGPGPRHRAPGPGPRSRGLGSGAPARSPGQGPRPGPGARARGPSGKPEVNFLVGPGYG